MALIDSSSFFQTIQSMNHYNCFKTSGKRSNPLSASKAVAKKISRSHSPHLSTSEECFGPYEPGMLLHGNSAVLLSSSESENENRFDDDGELCVESGKFSHLQEQTHYGKRSSIKILL